MFFLNFSDLIFRDFVACLVYPDQSLRKTQADKVKTLPRYKHCFLAARGPKVAAAVNVLPLIYFFFNRAGHEPQRFMFCLGFRRVGKSGPKPPPRLTLARLRFTPRLMCLPLQNSITQPDR